jgi:oligopeptide transport system ATP-binding protein
MTPNTTPLLIFKNVAKSFKYGKKILHAVQNVDLSIQQGETLGLVGESGCGKSTLGKMAVNLDFPSSGHIHFNGQNIHTLPHKEMQRLRRHMQMIFQDPYSSLNPRMRIEEIIGEGLDIHQIATGIERDNTVSKLMDMIGLEQNMKGRYPHEFSGGQRQRIGIARALAVNPLFIVYDEPLSALDACTQKQIMNLILSLKKNQGLTSLFISHDLNAIRVIADTVAVMYLGQIVEKAPAARLFISPLHPYTQALLSAIPSTNFVNKQKRIVLLGDPPSPLNPPKGCPFHPRCPKALAICAHSPPPIRQITSDHLISCHLH